MFKKFFLNKIENVQSKELEDFLSRMRYMDSDVLGGPAAITSLWADILNDQFGWICTIHMLLQHKILMPH